MAVVYRHVRHDTNEPFYIGVGKKKQRAYSLLKRNKKWYDIVKQTSYSVHILFEDVNDNFALEKEREFISLYKRQRDGGLLCNLHFGGDKFTIHSPAAKEKIGNAHKGVNNYNYGKKDSLETKERKSSAKRGELNSQSKLTKSQVIEIRELYATGKYLHREIAEMFNVSRSPITAILRGKRWKHI